MAKYSGTIGFVSEQETVPGVWTPVVTEKKMRGDLLRAGHSFDGGEKVNEDVTLQHRISLVVDGYAYENWRHIKFATFMNTKWKVTSIEVQRPRLILTLGGPWNG